MGQTTKGFWGIGPVESKEEAVKIINHISKVFEVLGSISVVGFFVFTDFSFQSRVVNAILGIIYIILGFSLGKLKKPVIAIVILVLSVCNVLIASLNLFGILGNTETRNLPIIGITMIIVSLQAIKATRKYNEEK